MFTALGLIAAYGWRRHLRELDAVDAQDSPLIGGVALLAFTGTGGENTDILAHLVGFVVGSRHRRDLRATPDAGAGRSGMQWAAGAAALACSRSPGRWHCADALAPESCGLPGLNVRS